jgi:hypothetical protein
VFLALRAVTGMVLSTTLHAQGTSSQPLQTQRDGYIPTVILPSCLAGSVLAWHLIFLDTERRAAELFATLGPDIEDDISERMDVYQPAQRGGRGLFDSSRRVELEEWRHYAQSLMTAHAGERERLLASGMTTTFRSLSIRTNWCAW